MRGARSWPRRPAESWAHLSYGSKSSEHLPADGLETSRSNVTCIRIYTEYLPAGASDTSGYTGKALYCIQNTCQQTVQKHYEIT